MANKKILKKVICGLTSVAVGAVAALSTCGLFSSKQDYLNNMQYKDEVVEALGADMQIMESKTHSLFANYDNIYRLKPNNNGKIYVYSERALSDNAKRDVGQCCEYLNNLYSFINDDYYFVNCSYKEYQQYQKEGKTVIKISYKNLEETNLGRTHINFFNEVNSSEGKYIYFQDINIYLNRDVFDRLSNDAQMFVLKHEFLHVLGLADTYEGYYDETSVINAGYLGVTHNYGPNELRMLYVAYANKHINKNGTLNKKKLQYAKDVLDRYERTYYSLLVKKIKEEKSLKLENIDKKEVLGCSITKNEENVKIDKDGNYTYEKNGAISEGKVIVADDYIILPNVLIENHNDFLILCKVDGDYYLYNVEAKYCAEQNQPELYDDVEFELQ